MTSHRDYDHLEALIEQLYDLDKNDLRQLIIEAQLIVDDPALDDDLQPAS